MKKFKMGVMALALTLGVAGAFATNPSAKTSRFLNPNWQTTDPSTGATVPVSSGGVYDPNRTRAQAQADFGCSGEGDLCASTVNSQDAAPNGISTIKKN
jgi:hypothetical protein